DAWTFADIAQSQKGWQARLNRLLKFNLIFLGGLILNVLLLNLFFNVVFGGQYRYLANLIAIALVTVWNFWLNLKLSWRVTDVKR
ncbi:MAG: GtrA family protein, partial [Cyanobacteria bacterium P01_F01_bin.4]